MEILKVSNVYKRFLVGNNYIYVLDDISFSLKEKEILVILGPSGSGKSTLLNLLYGIDKVDKGHIYYNDIDISLYSNRKLSNFRKNNLGLVFQDYNLLENLTVKQNIMINNNDFDKANEVMFDLDLIPLRNKYVYELSKGQRQKVAIARCLVKCAKVILLDEPTGSLDEKTGKKVLQIILDINNKYNTTIIIVTHNNSISLMGDKIITLESGRIKEIKENKRVLISNLNWG